jgi:hypothetical protein
MKQEFLSWGLCPHTPGIYRFRAKMGGGVRKDGTEAVLPFRHPGQRSGRIPALPYPLLGCRSVYVHCRLYAKAVDGV